MKNKRVGFGHGCRAAGFTPRMDSSRGFDHGVFVPLKLAFPAADVPVVQLSLLDSMSAQVGLPATPSVL